MSYLRTCLVTYFLGVDFLSWGRVVEMDTWSRIFAVSQMWAGVDGVKRGRVGDGGGVRNHLKWMAPMIKFS